MPHQTITSLPLPLYLAVPRHQPTLESVGLVPCSYTQPGLYVCLPQASVSSSSHISLPMKKSNVDVASTSVSLLVLGNFDCGSTRTTTTTDRMRHGCCMIVQLAFPPIFVRDQLLAVLCLHIFECAEQRISSFLHRQFSTLDSLSRTPSDEGCAMCGPPCCACGGHCER